MPMYFIVANVVEAIREGNTSVIKSASQKALCTVIVQSALSILSLSILNFYFTSFTSVFISPKNTFIAYKIPISTTIVIGKAIHAF